jgi:Leucine-rich repeat (LRR) protein
MRYPAPNMRISLQSVLCTAGLAAAATVAGCHGPYTYTFNDNVIFAPGKNTAANTSVLQDAALQACLNQYLEASGQTALAQVKLLACPGSGVETLVGIDALSGLEQLELSDNRISDLRPLVPLRNLRVLGLRNNPLTTVTPLLVLPILRFVSLTGDDQLRCNDVAALRNKLGNTLTGPLQCAE